LQKKSIKKAARFFEKRFGITAQPINLLLAHHALEMFVISFDQADYPKLNSAMANFESEVVCSREFLKFLFGYSEHTIMTIVTGFCSSELPEPNKRIKGIMNGMRDQLRQQILELLGEDGILIFPSFSTVAPFHNHAVWTPFNFIYNALWNTLGLPVISCPLGLCAQGMPTAVQIVGAPNSERLLVAAAEHLEQGFGGWTPPGEKI